jgi:hypothetical protein
MVNYHDPATIAQQSGAYAFLSGFMGWQHGLLVVIFDSGTREALARRGRYIHVSPHVLPSY